MSSYKVALWGAGQLGIKALENFSNKVDVVAFIDNSPAKQGNYINDIPILPPNNIHSLNLDEVMITSCYNLEIIAQLRALNLPDNTKISDFHLLPDKILANFDKQPLPKNYMDFAKLMADLRNDNISLLMQLDRISMLHHEALDIILFLASKIRGSILEIGTYIGAGSIALGHAKKYLNNKITDIVCVEVGGQHLKHPFIPSSDIHKDFEINTANFGVQKYLRLIKGSSKSDEVKAQLKRLFKMHSIQLLIIDSDGSIDEELAFLFPYLSNNCYLVFDDFAVRNNAKTNRVTKILENWHKSNYVTPLGIAGYGTWIGIINTKIFKNAFNSQKI